LIFRITTAIIITVYIVCGIGFFGETICFGCSDHAEEKLSAQCCPIHVSAGGCHPVENTEAHCSSCVDIKVIVGHSDHYQQSVKTEYNPMILLSAEVVTEFSFLFPDSLMFTSLRLDESDTIVLHKTVVIRT